MNSSKKILLLLAVMLIPSVAFASPRYCPPDDNWGRNWHDNGWRHDGSVNGPAYYYGSGYSARPAGWRDGSRFDARSAAAIQNGIRSGELSRNEARELWSREQQIRSDEARFTSDGRLSNGERRILSNEKSDFYRDLNHNLNDGERRW